MKAITPVISLIMLMLITVGIVGVSYTWFSGLATSSIQKSIAIPPGGAYCSNGEIKAYILNNGDTTLTTQDIIIAQVDGADVKGTPFFGDLSSGLIGWWNMDEGSGATAADMSGSGNAGTLQPAPCPENCPSWMNGKSHNALSFDGANDYVNVGSPAGLDDLSQFTWTSWIKLNGITPDIQKIMDKNTKRNRVNSGSILQMDITTSGTDASSVTSAGAVSVDMWKHVAFTYNDVGDRKIRIYVNGVEASYTTQTAATGTLTSDAASSLLIGTDTFWYFNGMIDEVKIYNKISEDVNIQQSRSGLVINYPGTEGRHNIRIATSSGAAETTVTCD